MAPLKKQFQKILIFAGVIFISLAGLAHHRAPEPSIKGIPITQLSKMQLIDAKAGFAANVNNNWVQSNQIFVSLSETHPQAIIGWIGLAKSATSLEQYNYAVAQAQKRLKDASEGEQLIAKLLAANVEGDRASQLSISQQLIKQYPQSSWAWIERGDVLGSTKDIETARKAFAQAAVVSPNDLEPYLRSGNRYLFSEPKDFHKAEYFFEQAVNLQSNNPWAHISLGDAHRAQLNLNASLADYTRASSLAPNQDVAFTKKGHVNTFLGNFEQARKDFDYAARVGSDVAANFNQNFKAFTFIYEDKLDKSVDMLAAHLKSIEQSNVEEHQKTEAKIYTVSNITQVALEKSDFINAQKYIDLRKTLVEQQLANVESENLKRTLRASHHFLQGRLENKKGNYSGALASADKMHLLLTSLKDERKYEDYYELQGLVSMSKEQWSQALAHFDRSNSDKLTVKYNKALAYEKVGDRKNALALYQAVRDYNFNSVDFAILRNKAQSRLLEVGTIVTSVD